jgi:hypothetical protein
VHVSHIKLESSGYQNAYAGLNATSHEFPCSKLDLARCMISINLQGRSFRAEVVRHGLVWATENFLMEPSAYAMRHLKPLPAGHLAAHPNFRRLTPSQKRPISERIGVGLAKFYSERILGVPRLYDVEGLRGTHAISVAYVNNGAVRSQPDLIGEAAPNKWHIVEAKGRSNKSSVAGAIRDGKLQAQNIQTINGFVPETRTVSASYIADDGITSTLQDPPSEGKRTVKLSEELAQRVYYSNLAELAQGRGREDRVDGRRVEFTGLIVEGLELGMDSEILETVRSGREISRSSTSLSTFIDREADSVSIGTDGIAIRRIDGKQSW